MPRPNHRARSALTARPVRGPGPGAAGRADGLPGCRGTGRTAMWGGPTGGVAAEPERAVGGPARPGRSSRRTASAAWAATVPDRAPGLRDHDDRVRRRAARAEGPDACTDAHPHRPAGVGRGRHGGQDGPQPGRPVVDLGQHAGRLGEVRVDGARGGVAGRRLGDGRDDLRGDPAPAGAGRQVLALHDQRQRLERDDGADDGVVEHDRPVADGGAVADAQRRHLHHAVLEQVRLQRDVPPDDRVVADVDEVELGHVGRGDAGPPADPRRRTGAARAAAAGCRTACRAATGPRRPRRAR